MPSLLEALEKKYFSDCQFENVNNDASNAAAEAEANRLISIFIPRLPPLTSVPELLVLNDCDIDCAGDCEAIKEKCQRVRELDLAQNKLQDWQEVFYILRHMPRIEFLNLSKNRLMGPISNLNAPTVSNLRNMVLNGTYLDWPCIEVLLENLPNLEELHLSLNDYKEVLIDTADNDAACAACVEKRRSVENCCCDLDDNHDDSDECTSRKCKKISAHNALKTLHFTGNPIDSWHEICRLGRVFPSLENLVLAECPIKSIDVGGSNCKLCAKHIETKQEETKMQEDATPYKHFFNLLLLNLSCASINTWDDIDQIAKFPKLRNLRVKNLPLWERFECTEHERRELLIARLPNVSLLNGGGVISADEREDAERAFIRYYMEKPECAQPNRYKELLAKHGKLDPLCNVNLKPDKRVKVLLTYKEKTEPRLLNIYCTVADLKMKLEKVFDLPHNKMRLFYLDKDFKEFGPEVMRYPNKRLYSYNIQLGDEIIIDEKK